MEGRRRMGGREGEMEEKGREGRYHMSGEPGLRVPLIHAVRVVRAVSLTQHPRVQQNVQLGYSSAKVEVALWGCREHRNRKRNRYRGRIRLDRMHD